MPPPFHPDQLEPGSQVGPWRVVASLGAGGFGRVFKVERAGRFYSLKMALRPAGPHAAEEEDINGRLSHEVAALLACAPHPNLPGVHAVDRWPDPPGGYLYFVTDYIDGETFHEWRWRVKPTAAHLLSVFTEVVRVVADLHRRGVHHRDLKGDNLLIRREDERPFFIDLGTVRLPGATTLTVGIAPASPHLLPPECVAFLREGTWQKGAHFDAGIPGDLYALGALLYEALTDGYAFDPKLPYDRLLPAIETVPPRPPHVVNPKVPRGLSDIALRLLEKQPEARYAGTEALLQALWDVAKEKRQPAWRVSLDRPEALDAPAGAEPETPRVRMVPELPREPVATDEPVPDVEPREAPAPEVAAVPAPPLAPPSKRASRRAALGLGGLLVFGLVAFGLSRLAPSPAGVTDPVPPPPVEKGSAVMPNRAESSPDASTLAVVSPPADGGMATDAADGGPVAVAPTLPGKPQSALRALSKAAVAACAAGACVTTPGARMAPPEGECPRGALEAHRKLGIATPRVVAGDEKASFHPDDYRFRPFPAPPEGPITIYIFKDAIVPKGTKFHGHFYRGKERYFVSFTEMEAVDGTRYPFCANATQGSDRQELGAPYAEESTPEKPMLYGTLTLATSNRLGRLFE